MTLNRALFTCSLETWRTPEDLFDALNREFHFDLDPCPARDPREAGLPLFGTDGLSISWRGHRVFCNPPYGRTVGRWLAKAREAELAVFLLPARTDTARWHQFAIGTNGADEIRFVRGRLRFNGAATGAPFPSVLLIFRKREQP